MEPDSKWVFGAVVLGAATGLGWLFRSGDLGWGSGIEIAVTFLTGFWFALRFHYTREVGAPASSTLGKLSTALIAVLGLSSYFLAGSKPWFLGVALVLAVGTLKDVEIIIGQRHLRRNLRQPDAHKKWRSRLIEMHHWYSVVRDFSMVSWWLLFGYLCFDLAPSANGLRLRLAFAAPYAALLIAWCIIKERTHGTEASLWRRRV